MERGEGRPMTMDKRNKEQRPISTTARYFEYYDLLKTFDGLYDRAKEGKEFRRLYDIITDRKNIVVAYRNIKRNTGSLTAGTNGRTILDWEKIETEEFIKYFQKRLEDYHPSPIRRKFIPKSNGKMRPLGIPNIEDRIIQQCIKQVLEPICEAHFHPHSFGFRPNRSAEHAISTFAQRVNRGKNYYVIDIDIKGFFDNVNHSKLIKQLWALGIHDKKVISIIKTMIQAPIAGENEITTKGVPQGGIISPLLANVVLNELDWWIGNQWETYNPYKQVYSIHLNPSGSINKSYQYKSLRKTTDLKEMYIIRYADDFKILCREKDHATRTFEAVKQWLWERLKLEISEEKSKILDIRKSTSQFLGFKFKAIKRGKVKGKVKHVLMSSMTDDSKQQVIDRIKTQVKKTQYKMDAKNANKLNSIIRGQQNYYEIATHASLDFGTISYKLRSFMRNRLGKVQRIPKTKLSVTHRERYKSNYRLFSVGKIPIYPIADVRHRNPMMFKRSICMYTEEGRKYIHEIIGHVDTNVLVYLMENPVNGESVEYNDNRISLYSAQKGRCSVTGYELSIHDMEVHHIKGRKVDNPDRFGNLTYVTTFVHRLIHATNADTIERNLSIVKPYNAQVLKKLNSFREAIGNFVIVLG